MPNKAESLDSIRKRLDAAILPSDAEGLVPIYAIDSAEDARLDSLSDLQRAWIKTKHWTPNEGAILMLPDDKGALAAVLFGTGGAGWAAKTPLLAGALAAALPEGGYRFAGPLDEPELAAYAWLAGLYAYTRYKSKAEPKEKRLALPQGVDKARLVAFAEALYFARDLINTPPNDLGPAELEHAVRELGEAHGATVKVIEGRTLLAENYPMIYAVGAASDRAPRLIDLAWGDASAPKVTLVGKGICFDTGGLDIKPASAMALMKKDMGGAAAAVACASMIMRTGLPVRLRLLIPAADNNISANAFRPGDVLQSRNGMTVEIGNTDAEGRLVLADALALADEEEPDYLATFATLTGAARSALGPDLPPLYATDEPLAEALLSAGLKIGDPLWRMPFWAPYDDWLKSSIADVNHISQGPFAGSITAALFLKRFVSKAARYAHFDIYGWVPKTLPGRPMGGEPQAARAMFAALEKAFRA